MESKMKIFLPVLALILTLSTVVFAAGCAGSTKISDIQAKPAQYAGKEVDIKGTVGETFWLAILNKGAYQLGDGSATIWVVTTQPSPQKGLQISTEGTVSTAIILGDRSLGTVVNETRRK
jgi:hypothetical protein